MIGTVDSFNGGEVLCTKIVRPDFRMEITARLRLPIGLSEEVILYALPSIITNYRSPYRPDDICLARWIHVLVGRSYAKK